MNRAIKTTKTIPKGSKRAREVFEQAHNIKIYSLDNGFTGRPMPDAPIIWGLGRELLHVSQGEALYHAHQSGLRAKLYDDGDGHYHLHIHGNLFYEFATEGA